MEDLSTDSRPFGNSRTTKKSSEPKDTKSEIPRCVTISNSTGVHIGSIINSQSAGLSSYRQQATAADRMQVPPNKNHLLNLLSSTRLISDADIDEISSHLGYKWKSLGRKMGYTNGQLDAVEDEERQLADRGYQLLIMWRDMMSSEASIANVTRLLMKVDAFDSVRNLCR